ncbi:phage-related minor tail protein, partial [Rhodococcus rhodochrous J45]
MSQTFGMDVNELAMSTSLLMRNHIAANGQEATDMLMAAFQRVPPAMRGELMPIIDEYGGYLTGLGFTGQEAMGIIVNAAQNGAIGMDKMGDALKEFQLKATDMSEGTKAAYDTLGMNQTDMTNRILAGGESAASAFQEIKNGLLGITDPAAQSQAALALFGTPLEDLGVDKIPMFLKQLSNADSAMGEFEGSVNEAGDILAGGPLESITVFGREMQNKIVGLLDDNVLPLFGEFSGALEDSEGNALAAAASMVGLGGAVGGFEEAKGVFDSVKEGVVGVKDSLVSAKDTAVSAWGSLKDAGGWVKTQATAVGSFVKTSASATVEAAKTATSWTITHAKVAGGWLVAQAKAIASFIATASAATFHAGVTALQWLIAQGRIAGGWVLTQVQAIASFVAVAASAALHAGATALQWIIANGRIVASFVATRVAMFASAAATGVMTAAQWLLNAALNANPIGLIVIALAALAAAVIWAWNNVDWFRDAVLTAWDWIKNAVSFAWENVLRPVLGFLGDRLRDAANAFVWLKDKAVAALQWIGDKALDIVGFFTSLPGKILGALGNGARMLYDWGRDMIQGLLDGAGSLLSKIGQFFLDKVPDWIRGPFEKALGIASPSKVFIAYGGNIGQGLIEGTKAMTGQVQATAQQLADAAADVTVTAPTPTPGLPATAGAATAVGADPAAAVGLGFDTETALTGINDLATGLQTTAAAVITPTVTGMQTGLTQYAETFPRVNDTLVQPAMTAMGLGIAAARTSLIDPALNAMQANTVRTGQVTTDVVNSTVVPQWQRMGAGIVGVKNGSIDPAFAGIQGGLRTVEGAFATGVSAISSQWDQMRGAVGRPVRFAIDTVFNNGLVGMWNSVSDLIGTQRMNPYVVGGFATGTSVLPGYSPGVDNLRFYTADGSTAIDLSGGEGIARPEVVRAMGTHEFDGLNAAARMGGVRGVRRYLGGFAGGGIVESIVDKVRRFFPGMSITSTYRNSNDLHGAGKAVDFSDGYDTTPGMQAAARFFYRNYGGMLAELIHWPLNGWQNVDEGRPFDFGAGTNAQHRNHVHVAAHRPLPEPGTVTDSLGAAGAPMWSFADYVKEQTRGAKDATAAAVGRFSAPGIVGSLPAKTYESMFTAADNKIQELAKAADIALGAGDMVERWRPTVIAALKRTGNPLSDAERTLQQIRIESGGDPNAINLWDINAQNGDPSVGLIQII